MVLKCRNGPSTSIVVTTTKSSRSVIIFLGVITPLLVLQFNKEPLFLNNIKINYDDVIESVVGGLINKASSTTTKSAAVPSSSVVTNDNNEQPLPLQQHTPFHNWDKTKDWICPITDTNNLEARAPNLTAAVITFRIAQRVAAYNNNNNNNNNNEGENVKDEIIKQFFSHWPGYMSIRERSTRRTATFLRTYKCGSITILDYYSRQLRKRKQDFDHYGTNLFWDNIDMARYVQKSSCICTAYRDPIDHFFSGLQYLENGRTKNRREKHWAPERVASYENLDILSQDRFIATIDFLLNGGWSKVAKFPALAGYGHVFLQTGYLVHLPIINRTISAYLDLYDDISTSVPRALNETCGLPKEVIPPKITHKESHEKIPGMKELHKQLWNGGSISSMGTATTTTTAAKKEEDLSPRTPLLQSKLEALCLLHAADYACLSSVLKKSAPKICAETYQKYL